MAEAASQLAKMAFHLSWGSRDSKSSIEPGSKFCTGTGSLFFGSLVTSSTLGSGGLKTFQSGGWLLASYFGSTTGGMQSRFESWLSWLFWWIDEILWRTTLLEIHGCSSHLSMLGTVSACSIWMIDSMFLRVRTLSSRPCSLSKAC